MTLAAVFTPGSAFTFAASAHARKGFGYTFAFAAFIYKIKFNYSAAKYGQAHEGLDRFIILNNRF